MAPSPGAAGCCFDRFRLIQPLPLRSEKSAPLNLDTSLVDSKHNRRMISVEHSGIIMQGITLLISVPDNRLLFWCVVDASSSFHGNVPLRLRIALHRPVELTARSGLLTLKSTAIIVHPMPAGRQASLCQGSFFLYVFV